MKQTFFIQSLRRVGGIALSLSLVAGLFPTEPADAAASPKPAKKSISLEEGKTGKVRIKANGWSIKAVKASSKSKNIKVKATKKALTITAVSEGSGTATVTIKAKKAKQTKKFKSTLTVKISEPAKGKEILEKYTADGLLNRPREVSIQAFAGTLKEERVPGDVEKIVKKNSDNLTVKAYNIDGIHFLDLKLDDGKKKPLLIYIPSGDAPKNQFFWEEDGTSSRACACAMAGLRVVSIDTPGCGSSEVGPIDALASFAETVSYIDKLVEYYNTIDDVEAGNFALQGMSKGGNITFAYVAHGKYKPTAILSEAGIPDYCDLTDGPLFDAFYLGRGGQSTIMSKKQIRTFAKRYSPIQWPEKFKDVYIFTANYANDLVGLPTSCKTLEQELTKLGSTRFSINILDGDGHAPIPLVDEKGVEVLTKVLLG